MAGTILRELRMAVRAHLRDKGFASTVVITLLACVAANTLTFAVVNSVLLRPLPVPDADSIYLMANRYPNAGVSESNQSASGDYIDRLTAVPGLADQALFRQDAYTMDFNGVAEQVEGMRVTPSFFQLVRTQPVLGRAFSEADAEPGNARKVILSYPLWQQMFAGKADALGQSIRMDGRPYEVTGVMPPAFHFIAPDVRMWTPLALTAEDKQTHHSNNYFNAGRLKPGATVAQVQAQVDASNRANMDRYPGLKQVLINAGFHTKVESMRHMLVRNVEGVLYLLWAAAVLVLFIGGLNVANLALARLAARRKEVATRLALGATRWQLMRQSVIESVMITAVGGALGVAAAYLLLPVMAVAGMDQLPRAGEVEIDGMVALVSMALACAVGVAMGLLPLTNLFPASLSESLRDDNRTGTSGRGTRRVRQALVVAEVAFAFLLLAGAGLFLTSFRNLTKVDPGFETAGVYTSSMSAPQVRYEGGKELRSLVNRTLEKVRALPGVAAAGVTTTIPLGRGFNDSVILAEGRVMRPGESVVSPKRLEVSPGFFETMRMPILKGRTFTERDDDTTERVMVVDENMARRFWPDSDPIGRRMYSPDSPNDLNPTPTTKWIRVVGVVRSIRMKSLSETDSVGAYYYPYAQTARHDFSLVVRAAPGAGDLTRPIRSVIAGIDPQIALFDVRTMEERTDLSLASRRTSMTLAVAFAGLALFLSATGIYGVLAFLVTQRRREIGIRMALGSSAGRVAALVAKEGLALVGAGLVIGLAGAAAMQQAIASEVYGVQPMDPVVLSLVMLTLAAAGALACILPARRALQVDPMTVLHE